MTERLVSLTGAGKTVNQPKESRVNAIFRKGDGYGFLFAANYEELPAFQAKLAQLRGEEVPVQMMVEGEEIEGGEGEDAADSETVTQSDSGIVEQSGSEATADESVELKKEAVEGEDEKAGSQAIAA